MYRIGLIHPGRHGWGFSSRFKNTLKKLIKNLDLYKLPVDNAMHKRGEMIWVEIAKGEVDLEKRYETKTRYADE